MRRLWIVVLLGLLAIAPASAEEQERVWLPLVLTSEVQHCRRCVTLPVEP